MLNFECSSSDNQCERSIPTMENQNSDDISRIIFSDEFCTIASSLLRDFSVMWNPLKLELKTFLFPSKCSFSNQAVYFFHVLIFYEGIVLQFKNVISCSIISSCVSQNTVFLKNLIKSQKLLVTSIIYEKIIRECEMKISVILSFHVNSRKSHEVFCFSFYLKYKNKNKN